MSDIKFSLCCTFSLIIPSSYTILSTAEIIWVIDGSPLMRIFSHGATLSPSLFMEICNSWKKVPWLKHWLNLLRATFTLQDKERKKNNIKVNKDVQVNNTIYENILRKISITDTRMVSKLQNISQMFIHFIKYILFNTMYILLHLGQWLESRACSIC